MNNLSQEHANIYKFIARAFMPILLATAVFGCGSAEGPDALNQRPPAVPTTVFPACVACHDTPTTTRRQIVGAGGDFAGNLSIVSHHVLGVDPTQEQCLVCHDFSAHGSGVVILRHADTGAGIIYDPANPATLEPFCLSCHDDNGATATFLASGSPLKPFNDGAVLGDPPYPYGRRIASSWAKSYGHGPLGGHGAGNTLTCMGEGLPGTGCHGNNGAINGHGSANQILSTRGFNYNIGGTYNEFDFELCFSCHASYSGVAKEDILGVRFGGLLDGAYGALVGPNGPAGLNPPYYTPGFRTRFADHNDSDPSHPYNDPVFWGPTDMNLHWFHLGLQTSNLRGTGVSSRLVCVNCHDVHGSNTQFGALYDEIGYIHIMDGVNLLGQMGLEAYEPGFPSSTQLLNNYPTYCAFNCHPVQDVTRAWFAPIAE